MVIKYRHKVIDDDISQRLKDIFEHIQSNYNITFHEWNHNCDHVHIMFKANPNSELSKYINAYKSASSRLIKKEYPQIKNKLWQNCFWTKSFCLISTGGESIDVIERYIKSQGDNNYE